MRRVLQNCTTPRDRVKAIKNVKLKNLKLPLYSVLYLRLPTIIEIIPNYHSVTEID